MSTYNNVLMACVKRENTVWAWSATKSHGNVREFYVEFYIVWRVVTLLFAGLRETRIR